MKDKERLRGNMNIVSAVYAEAWVGAQTYSEFRENT